MKHKILIWDNDGTVTGSTDPNDSSNKAKVILTNVEATMLSADFNFIISGFKSPESEAQNFDPKKVIAKFKELMTQLPINAAVFSPSIGGIACYVVIKKLDGNLFIKKAHEDPLYAEYIGKFKKPDIGMFVVIRDIALEEYNQAIDKNSAIMIGDTWHDKAAAESFGINFIEASVIHRSGASTLKL